MRRTASRGGTRGRLRSTDLTVDLGWAKLPVTIESPTEAPGQLRVVRPTKLKLVAAIALLAIATLLGTSVWLGGGMVGSSRTPPGVDAPQHSFMAARIALAETIASDDVLVSDPRGGTRAADYYPLAMHAAIAMAFAITGATVAGLTNLTVLCVAAFVLPLGLFALVRQLAPDLPLAAGFSAFLAMLFDLFPYLPFWWGGSNTIVAVAMLRVTIVIVFRAISSRWAWPSAILSALLILSISRRTTARLCSW